MSDSTPTVWRALGVRAVLFLSLWLVLTGLDPDGLVFGAVATIAATTLSARLLPPTRGGAFWRALPMLPGFLWHSLLGGADVARRAIDPRMPLAPAWRIIPCTVSISGRFVIGSEFSLMPGTLIAGCRKGCYLVHLLDKSQPITTAIEREELRLRPALASDEFAVGRDEIGARNPGNDEAS